MQRMFRILVYMGTLLTDHSIKSLEQEIEGLQGSGTRSHGRR